MKADDMVETKSFGEWLRHRRREMDLTQEELARQVGCARITVRKIEAGQMRPSKQLAELLLEQLRVAANERESIMHFARGGESVQSITTTVPLDNLPNPISSFIGREREIGDVKRLMKLSRLVTLTGAGGYGKTRLAIEAASQMMDLFSDGVWFVAFAPLSDSTLVLQTIATTLRVRESPGKPLIETLCAYLYSKRLLLVFDNCEHLIGECARVADTLLQACPQLCILATSREALGIGGEEQYQVLSLSLPQAAEITSPGQLEKSEAVCLFVNRVAMVQPTFVLTAENSSPIVQICQRLDGMPLAIELAAARSRTLSVQQIAERLDDRFHLLTTGNRTGPPRQQTLAATLDWSYSLLSAKEQKVLNRLSVFASGATMEAAEAVCTGEGVESDEVLDVLFNLVNKSLVTPSKLVGGETRYLLLETIREYGREKLGESGEGDESKNCHLNYFVQWAEKAEPYLSGGEQVLWLKRYEVEHDNLRAALEWSLLAANRADTGLRLAANTAIFWKLHGYHSEGRMRLAAALAQEAVQRPTLVRAQALHSACILAFFQSDYSAARALAEESLVICREQGIAGRLGIANSLEMLAEIASETGDYSAAAKLYEQALSLYRDVGDLVGIGDTLKMLGWGAMRTGDYEQAESRLNEGLIACRKSGDLRQISSALAGLGELAVRRGRYKRASDLLSESLNICRRSGEKWGIAIALGSLGWAKLRQHDFIEMRKLLGESLDLRMETGDIGGIAWCLEKLAVANSLQSHLQTAATIFGAASTLRASVGSVMDATDRPDYERMISRLRTALGKQMFATAWTKGQAMTSDQAIDYALAEPEPAEMEVSLKENLGGLTVREREVAVMIALGKSNREIAKAMTVSAKTVEAYVTRILYKLGFNSRAQIATWMIEKGFDEKELQ